MRSRPWRITCSRAIASIVLFTAADLSPTGITGRSIELRWTAPPEPASRYRIQVRDAAGDMIASSDTVTFTVERR